MIDKAWNFISLNRFFFYMMAFLCFNAFDLYRDYVNYQFGEIQLELLEQSFKV